FDFSLQNIYIVMLPDEGLSRIRRQYLKDTCEEVVLSNLIAGAQVCQTDEVLEADLLYKTNAQEEFGAGTKADIAGPASGSLEVGQQDKTRIEIRGDDLFLGAKVHQHCFQLDRGRIAQKGQTVATRN